MISTQATVKGAGLLEFMLALAIAITIILASFLQYEHMRWQRDLEVIKHSEALLQQATKTYWLQNCKTLTAPQAIPLQAVLKILPKHQRASIRNPWSKNTNEVFEIQLQTYTDRTTGKNLWQFMIETAMNKPNKVMDAIANALNAVNIDNKVRWTFIPWQKPAAYDEHLDVSNISYDYYTRKVGSQTEDSFYCSPYEKSTT